MSPSAPHLTGPQVSTGRPVLCKESAVHSSWAAGTEWIPKILEGHNEVLILQAKYPQFSSLSPEERGSRLCSISMTFSGFSPPASLLDLQSWRYTWRSHPSGAEGQNSPRCPAAHAVGMSSGHRDIWAVSVHCQVIYSFSSTSTPSPSPKGCSQSVHPSDYTGNGDCPNSVQNFAYGLVELHELHREINTTDNINNCKW